MSAPFELLPGEIVVDNFAGGGGASTGIEAAIGKPADIAINHDPVAVAMHKANHPHTRHYIEDVWQVSPREVAAGRPVGLAWFSPDCRHFSRAKGTAPVSDSVRGLAWVVIRWAKEVQPRVIMLENVEEFLSWGPLDDEGRPVKSRAGETFREWLAELAGLGYTIEYQSLVAADYGAPTTRRRLFLVARRDRENPSWPEPTHGVGRAQAWRTAAEVIDWSIECPSIFGRRRPLAEATLRRIAAGVKRYVVDAKSPFLIRTDMQSGNHLRGVASADEPLRTITSSGGLAVVSPCIVPLTHQGGERVHSLEDPVRTITAAHRGELALCTPFVVRHGHYSTITGAGLVEGAGAGTFRGQPIEQPLATVCGTNDKHLVCPVIVKHYGGPNGHPAVGHEVSRPLGTVTARDHHALAAAFLTKFYGTATTGASLDAPVPTVTSGGGKGGGHIAQVRAFLVKYYGAGGKSQTADVDEPMHTITSKARFGLVEVHGEAYQIVDIGMRMLQPKELFAAQGFPESYEIAPFYYGKPITKTDQIRLVGNSVPPPVAEAVVRANARVVPRDWRG